MSMSCFDCHDYMDGFNRGKKEGLIEELKKIKNRIIDEINQRTQISAYIDIVTGLEISLRFIDERISELKGESKECPYFDYEVGTCRRSETKFDELNNLYYGMTDSMQKAVKDIMLVANGKDIEE